MTSSYRSRRLEVGTQKPARQPLLLTNGFSTLLLVFHPYYRNAFEFTTGPAESLDGRSVIPVHFAHIQGRERRRPWLCVGGSFRWSWKERRGWKRTRARWSGWRRAWSTR